MKRCYLFFIAIAILLINVNVGSSQEIENPAKKTLPSPLIDEQGNEIKTKRKWKEQKSKIKKRWGDYLGIIPSNPNPVEMKVISEDRNEGVIRQLVEYEGEPGKRVQGYLIKPMNVKGKLPGIVVLHSTVDEPLSFISGIKKSPDIAPFGLSLAQQGYITFSPINFLWNDTGGRDYKEQTIHVMNDHPGSKGMAKMLFDAMRAVDVLISIPEVDKRRVATVGHSLGAKEALYLGAFDDRVDVVVSIEGGIGIPFTNWHDVWYLGPEIHSFGHDHQEVIALNANRPFLLIGGESADGEKSRLYIDAVKPVYKLLKHEDHIELKTHNAGHNVTPQADAWVFEWLRKHL